MMHKLETARLWLRPCGLEDLERAQALWTNDRVRHFLFDDRLISPEEARSFVETSLADFSQCGYGLWLVFAHDTDQLVGFVGFLRTGEAAPDLIYGLHPDYWGVGYATEAVDAVMRHAFENLGLAKVKADVDEPKRGSVRVLEKLVVSLIFRDEQAPG
ncbi:MAG: GNAT family N-acetyltransferase [Chloroflexaceae bacterium]|nr:GNAT family N-acetyltransferase [Chloroflexaceae bacterium]